MMTNFYARISSVYRHFIRTSEKCYQTQTHAKQITHTTMSAIAAQQSIAFRANVSAKTVSSSKRQSKKIVRSLRVEAAKKSVGDLSKGDLEGARSFFYKGWGGKRCARICVSFRRCSFAFYRGVRLLYSNLLLQFFVLPSLAALVIKEREREEGEERKVISGIPKIRSLFSPVTIKPHPRENARNRKLTVWVFVDVGCFCTRRRVKGTEERIKTNFARV